MAKTADYSKVAGPIAVAVYNEDGSIHTHFAATKYQAVVLAKSLGAVDIQEVSPCKLFPNLPSSTSKPGRASGSGGGRSRKSSRSKGTGGSGTA